MNKKIDFKKLAEQSWKEFEEARIECVGNISKTDNPREIYPQLNNLFRLYDKSVLFSENQYQANKEGAYMSSFDTSIHFLDAKGAKLYDVLKEFFGNDLGVTGMFQLVGMIRAYANLD